MLNLSKKVEQQISARVKRAIEKKVFPGCVVGYVKKNGERTVLPFGSFTYALDSPTVKEDTIYDTASLTKSIPTGSLALTLIDQNTLKLTDKLIDFVPEFRNSENGNKVSGTYYVREHKVSGTLYSDRQIVIATALGRTEYMRTVTINYANYEASMI